jgi:hypothetical protein
MTLNEIIQDIHDLDAELAGLAGKALWVALR